MYLEDTLYFCAVHFMKNLICGSILMLQVAAYVAVGGLIIA